MVFTIIIKKVFKWKPHEFKYLFLGILSTSTWAKLQSYCSRVDKLPFYLLYYSKPANFIYCFQITVFMGKLLTIYNIRGNLPIYPIKGELVNNSPLLESNFVTIYPIGGKLVTNLPY